MHTRIAVIAVGIAALALVACRDGEGDETQQAGTAGAETRAPTEATAQDATSDTGAAGRGGPVAADAFIACFDKRGYSEQRLQQPFGVSATLADVRGYPVTSVLLNSDRGAIYGTAVSFFESAAKREEATSKLKLDFGSADVPEADERGSAVVEYVSKPARPATRAEVLECLGGG